MKIRMITIVLLFIFSKSNCKEAPVFYLHHKHAKMPVVIRGNADSNVLIVFLHGGPGGTAQKKIGLSAFLQLEEDFKIAYWDQRASGSSKGGKHRRYLTLEQYVEDLDYLVDRLKFFYPDDDIFLMGHCWGGTLGTAYLLDEIRQQKISGWIEVDGAHNNPKGDSLSMEWVKDYARQKIEMKEKMRLWKSALRWYDHHPHFPSNALSHYYFVKKAKGYVLHPTSEPEPTYTFNDFVKKPVKVISFYLNYKRTLSRLLISDLNFSPQMNCITLPSLIIWGEKDGVIPVDMAYDALYALGTRESDKHLVVFRDTAHMIFYEQPDSFAAVVKSFILKYRNKDGIPVV